MSDQHLSVGQALSRAMARAEELRRSSDRKPRIRLMTQWGDHADGVTIVARVAAKTNAELEAQADLGVRHVPFAELDARAGELTDLVEAAAAEVLAAVAAAPPPGPRPSTADDFDADAYEAVEQTALKGMFGVADEVIRNAPAALSTGSTAEACVSAALRVAVLAAIAARIYQPDLLDMLKMAISDLRKDQGMIRPPGAQAH
uniref:hypothetical protein n=1 Tax=uncultured Caulobacter sp. TaxID=158749 RepID=UPI0025D3975D|nr:hypothetical protein [uncultured Caulobacter sp.]